MKRFFDGVNLFLVMGILGLAVWAWPAGESQATRAM